MMRIAINNLTVTLIKIGELVNEKLAQSRRIQVMAIPTPYYCDWTRGLDDFWLVSSGRFSFCGCRRDTKRGTALSAVKNH
jgi:hypothetical protein